MENKRHPRIQLAWIYKLKKAYLTKELQKRSLPTEGTVGELRVRLKNFMTIELLSAQWMPEAAKTSQEDCE